MNEDNKELEQMKSEMNDIRKMLEEIKDDTAYFKQFMKKYDIPIPEETQAQKEATVSSEVRAETNQKKKVKSVTPKL